MGFGVFYSRAVTKGQCMPARCASGPELSEGFAQAAGAIDEIKPAAQIMEEMCSTAIATLRHNAGRVARL